MTILFDTPAASLNARSGSIQKVALLNGIVQERLGADIDSMNASVLGARYIDGDAMIQHTQYNATNQTQSKAIPGDWIYDDAGRYQNLLDDYSDLAVMSETRVMSIHLPTSTPPNIDFFVNGQFDGRFILVLMDRNATDFAWEVGGAAQPTRMSGLSFTWFQSFILNHSLGITGVSGGLFETILPHPYTQDVAGPAWKDIEGFVGIPGLGGGGWFFRLQPCTTFTHDSSWERLAASSQGRTCLAYKKIGLTEWFVVGIDFNVLSKQFGSQNPGPFPIDAFNSMLLQRTLFCDNIYMGIGEQN